MRGAGYARTSNYVRRSSIPSRRPCLARASMLACMLVLSTPRSTSSILVQQTYGTANTMTLSVLRLLRWARYMYGRRGLRGLVLGPGSTVSSLVDARSSAGTCPISRLLWRWWVRRGRSSRLRSLLLRRHVDEDDEDQARVNAGSGSHNLTAPTWHAKDVGGLIHEHLWDRRTESLSVRRGRGSHEERIEAKHTSSLPRFGPHGCVKPYSCFVVCIEFLLGSAECYSTHQQLTRPSVSVP